MAFQTLGNGEFAFMADITGLQTFPDFYRFTALNTMAQWGWHTSPNPNGYDLGALPLPYPDTHGRSVGYLYSKVPGREAEVEWLRNNPHKLNLGRIGLCLLRHDGSPAECGDLREIHQTLDLWSGWLTSEFVFDGQPVAVTTAVHPTLDAVVAQIRSPLLADGRLRVRLAFPYGPDLKKWHLATADWTQPGAHQTVAQSCGPNAVEFRRMVDADRYSVRMEWSDAATWKQAGPHEFLLQPRCGMQELGLVCAFSPETLPLALPEAPQAMEETRLHWEKFWSEGGAIDLSGSRDTRWRELERRAVLSQYLTAVQCAGSLPPQETGLTCNSWAGKFHMEMYWWHGVHFAAWGRFPLLERSLGVFERMLPKARSLARQQGYAGARWLKCVGADGDQMPCYCEPYLIWQQPHAIYFAELAYRHDPSPATVQRWAPLVFETADFMASYAAYDRRRGEYVLGPPLMLVSENLPVTETMNGTFELSYWRTGLRLAQQWRQRVGLAPNAEWAKVLDKLAPLPTTNGMYLICEGLNETYGKFNFEHPAILGAYGMLPGDGVDPAAMNRTFNAIWDGWQWDKCWGWDHPMAAMCATRLGKPSLAIDALLRDVPSNKYLPNGHNWLGEWLPVYLPANGGLLAAVAMMAAGWEGAPQRPAPGFPADGNWQVRSEGLGSLF